MPEHFVALTTDDLRSMLQNAWDDARNASKPLLDQLRFNERYSIGLVDANIFASASNGHSVSSFTPGSNAPTAADTRRGWRQLVELYYKCNEYLQRCAKYGVDAFEVKNRTGFPDNPTIIADASLRVTTDQYGKWQDLCDIYNFDSSNIIGKVVDQNAVYIWTMSLLIPVTESRSDYSQAFEGGIVAW